MDKRDSTKLQLAFRKPVKGFADWFLYKLIGKYIHVEIVFPGPCYDNCFSSRGRDKPKGVNFKKINFSHPDRWDFLTVGGVDIIDLRKECVRYVGCKYDWKGAIWLGTFPGLKRQNPKKWFCSEICRKVLNIKPTFVTPWRMFKELIK